MHSCWTGTQRIVITDVCRALTCEGQASERSGKLNCWANESRPAKKGCINAQIYLTLGMVGLDLSVQANFCWWLERMYLCLKSGWSLVSDLQAMYKNFRTWARCLLSYWRAGLVWQSLHLSNLIMSDGLTGLHGDSLISNSPRHSRDLDLWARSQVIGTRHLMRRISKSSPHKNYVWRVSVPSSHQRSQCRCFHQPQQ